MAYLHRYIDYCQDQALVLSLREICERVAQKVCGRDAVRSKFPALMKENRRRITRSTAGGATATSTISGLARTRWWAARGIAMTTTMTSTWTKKSTSSTQAGTARANRRIRWCHRLSAAILESPVLALPNPCPSRSFSRPSTRIPSSSHRSHHNRSGRRRRLAPAHRPHRASCTAARRARASCSPRRTASS